MVSLYLINIINKGVIFMNKKSLKVLLQFLCMVVISGFLFVGCDLFQPANTSNNSEVLDEDSGETRNFPTTPRPNNGLPEGIGNFRIGHWTSYANPVNGQIRLRIVVTNAAGTEITNCIQTFTYEEGKDNQWINWGLHLFEWDFASVGPFVTIRFYKDGTDSSTTHTETKTRTFKFEQSAGAETGAIAKLFAKIVFNFKFNQEFTHTWTDTFTRKDDDVHMGTMIVNYDHYLDHHYDCGDLEFKMARYYFDLNGNQSYDQSISTSQINLKGRCPNGSPSSGAFISVQKSDSNWNRYGTEVGGWVGETDRASIYNGTFNVRNFASNGGLVLKFGNYYRIKYAVTIPTWYAKSILIYYNVPDPTPNPCIGAYSRGYHDGVEGALLGRLGETYDDPFNCSEYNRGFWDGVYSVVIPHY
jgi:hypothetical protein